MFHTFGWPEALIILTLVVIVFGVGKLPQIGGALGKGIREFRRGKADLGALGTEEEDVEETSSHKRSPEKLTEAR